MVCFRFFVLLLLIGAASVVFLFVSPVQSQSTVTVTATVAEQSSPPGGGGGGGGGGPTTPIATGVIFSGRAYPLSRVSVLKDGQLAISTIAGPDANFSVSLTNLTAGSYVFSVYGEDSAGRRSSLFTFPVIVTSGATTTISGIFIAPTIDVDKSQVKRGENIAIFGQSIPSGKIIISVASPEEFFVETTADNGGIYLYDFDTSPLEIGQHYAKSKASIGTQLSVFGQTAGFQVGSSTVPKITTCGRADLNCDGKVNLVDFSIAAYWYRRTLSASFAEIESERLNNDNKIDLIDFSLIAFYWTG